MVLPWMPAAVRDLLMSDATFTTLIPADRVVFKAPPTVTEPFVVIQVPNAAPSTGDGVGWKPMVQVDAFTPAGDNGAAETVWNLTAAAARILGRARNISYSGVTYSGRHFDGPRPDVDTSRGTSSPLARATVRAELVLHAR